MAGTQATGDGVLRVQEGALASTDLLILMPAPIEMLNWEARWKISEL